MTSPDHLVIVCGHGIWLGGPKKGWDESEWLIESYKAGETPTFIEHIKAGVKIMAENPNAVLVFSGETPVSEAASYANLAAANEYFGLLPPGDRDPASSSRILLEERAMDSYYNILFSLVLFWRKHHAWPRCLTIVSHAFKRRRIVDGHCAALGFPSPRINFVGINPPGIDSPETPAAERNDSHGVSFGEQVSREKMEAMSAGVAQVADDWTQDPHGSGVVLARKRKERNPWNVGQKLFSGEEERMRSGVRTQILEDGTEVLAQDLQAPWGPGS